MNIKGISQNSFGASYSVIVKNNLGLHTYPCGVISTITKHTTKPIFFSAPNVEKIDVRGSVMRILTMELSKGKKIQIDVDDDYPTKILKDILDCVSATDDAQIAKIAEKYKKKIDSIV